MPTRSVAHRRAHPHHDFFNPTGQHPQRDFSTGEFGADLDVNPVDGKNSARHRLPAGHHRSDERSQVHPHMVAFGNFHPISPMERETASIPVPRSPIFHDRDALLSLLVSSLPARIQSPHAKKIRRIAGWANGAKTDWRCSLPARTRKPLCETTLVALAWLPEPPLPARHHPNAQEQIGYGMGGHAIPDVSGLCHQPSDQ